MLAKIRAALKTEIRITRKGEVADPTDALILFSEDAIKRALKAYEDGRAL